MPVSNADLRQLLKLTRPLVCFDVETHDKCPIEQARIVEFGLIVFYPDKEPKRWESLIRLPPGVKVHPSTLDVHGITQERLDEQWCSNCKTAACSCQSTKNWGYRWPTFAEVANNLAKGMVNCDFCGYNLEAFDLKVVAVEMRRCGVPWSYEGAHVLDPLKLWRKLQTRTLTDFVREYAGREPSGAHRALNDIQDTVDGAFGMIQRHGLPTTVKECHDLCRDAEAIDADGKFKWKGDVAIISFGKWNGTELSKGAKCVCYDPNRCKCFRGYLGWMLTGDFAPETKRIAQEALDGKFPTKTC